MVFATTCVAHRRKPSGASFFRYRAFVSNRWQMFLKSAGQSARIDVWIGQNVAISTLQGYRRYCLIRDGSWRRKCFDDRQTL